MANDCFTMYRFYGERTKEFKLDIQKTIDRHNGDKWLKWLAVDLLGYTEEQISNHKIYVRGELIFIDGEDEELFIDTDTAWNPCNELFNQLAEKYELDIYWMADERGCCGVWSNDVDRHVWDWQYVIYNQHTCEEECFADEEQALEWVNNIRKNNNLPTIKAFDELADDDDWSITEVEYVNE